jgi:hypothetical protein
VPAEIEPPELAALVAYEERPRVGDWSLRSALCRYAQPEPVRVSEVLELVRRIEFAAHKPLSRLAKEGPALWDELQAGPTDGDLLLGLLAAMAELDRLGDVLADWAHDRDGKEPAGTVDATTASVARRLDELGVAREERVRPPGAGRGRG